MTFLHPRLRKWLRANTIGMTAKELAESNKTNEANVLNALRRMPDVYIDRWTENSNHGRGPQHVAVWCVVIPPPDCPKPSGKTRSRKPFKRRIILL